MKNQNKIIIITLLFLIFFIGNVRAADWDNKIIYENNDLKLDFRNSILGIIPTSEIGTAELKSHPSINYVLHVPAGNQIVMYYDFNFLELYKGGLGTVEFINMKTKKPVDREWHYVYWANETWLPYDSRDIPKGNIRIGIMVDVQIRDHIDGIWTIAGKRINKHAEWTEDLSVGLIRAFDYMEGGGAIAVDSSGQGNGTIYTDGTHAENISSKMDYGYNFTALGNYSRIDFGYTTNLTILIGFKTPLEETKYIVSGGTGDIRVNTSGYVGTSLSSVVYGNQTINNNDWHLAILSFENVTNTTILMVDGNLAYKSNAIKSIGNHSWWEIPRSNVGAAGVSIDLAYFWNRTLTDAEYTQLWNSGSWLTYLSVVPILNLELIFPVNNSNFTTSDIYFTSNLTDPEGSGITNLTVETFYDNGTLIYSSTNSSGIEAIYNYSHSFPDGLYFWNETAYDGSDVPTGSDTWYFLIDTVPPDVNITWPLDGINYTDYATNNSLIIYLNYTASDTNLNKCWYEFNDTNTSFTDCSTNASLVIPFGQYYFIVWANDTAGNSAGDPVNATFDYKLFMDNLTYNNQTIEGSSETFDFEFHLGDTISDTVTRAQLTYGNTINNATILDVDGKNYEIGATITIPSVVSDTNYTFFFNVTMSNGITYNTSGYNQTVLNIAADDCSTFSTIIFNFTSLDEASQVNLSTLTNETVIELSLNLLSFDRTYYLVNFSNTYENINPALVCVNGTIPSGITIPTDVIVKYYGDGYATEYYNIKNYSLTNTSTYQNISLYDLDSTDSTEFKITALGDNFIPIQGALILIQREYIPENDTYKTVEIPITDTNGETLAHLVKNDVVYNFIVIVNGSVEASLIKVIAFCSASGSCEIEIDKEGSTIGFEYFNQGISFGAPTYNSNTSKVSFIFTSIDGAAHTVSMSVSQHNIYGNATVCNDSLSSASGTLSCTVPGTIEDASLNVNITTDGELTAVRSITINSFSYGDVGYVVWFVLTLFLIFIFSHSKTGILISMAVSYIGATSLGLAKGDIIGLASAGIWILVVTLIGIWKLNKTRVQ